MSALLLAYVLGLTFFVVPKTFEQFILVCMGFSLGVILATPCGMYIGRKKAGKAQRGYPSVETPDHPAS